MSNEKENSSRISKSRINKTQKKIKLNSPKNDSLRLSNREIKRDDSIKIHKNFDLSPKNSLNNLICIKKPKNKNTNNNMKNGNLNNILNGNTIEINYNKNEINNISNKNKQDIESLLNNNYNRHKVYSDFSEKDKSTFELEHKNTNNTNNNNETITNDDNGSFFFSPRRNLKTNSFLKNNKRSNKNSIDFDYNNNYRLMVHSPASKTINYISHKKIPNHISSSNDQISTDSNFVNNNKNYSLLNSTNDFLNNNNIKMNNIKNFHGLFHQNIKQKIEDFEKKESEEPKIPILRLRKSSNKSNTEDNETEKSEKNNEYQKRINSINIEDDNINNKEEKEKEKEIYEDGNETPKNKINSINKKESGFLKKLKEKTERFKKRLSPLNRTSRRRKTKIEENVIFLREALNEDNTFNAPKKTSNKKSNKNFKKQLSKISEISLQRDDERKQTSSYVFLETKMESIKQIKEIIEEQIDNNRFKRKLTPIIKKGHSIFKKIIDLIEKKKKLIDIDASSSNLSSEKSQKKSTVKSTSTIHFFDLRHFSVRLSINDFHVKINKNLYDIKKQKLINFLVYGIREIDENLEINRINSKDKLIENSMQIAMNYKNLLKEGYHYLNEVFKKNNEYNLKSQKYFKEINQKMLKKCEIEIVYDYLKLTNQKVQNISPFNFNQLLLNNYFKINLHEQIIKGKYLNTDLGNEEMPNLIFINFEKNHRKSIKTIRRFNNQIILSELPIILSKISLEFYNKFLILDIKEYYNSDDCLNIDTYKSNIKLLLKKTLTESNENMSRHYYFHHSHHHSNHAFRRNSLVYHKARLSIKNQLLRTGSHLSHLKLFDENKCKILNKQFFERKRNSYENKLIGIRKRREKNKINLTIRKKQIALYISPVNSQNNNFKLTNTNNVSLRKYDREMTIFKTLKIKDDLLRKCKNFKETLILFIKHGDYHNFKKVFKKFKANPEIVDNEGNSLLNLAVQCDLKRIVKYLLNQGANPNSQNYKLNSPLHYALTYKNFELADILIKYGANENLKNGEGLTAWQCLNYDNSIL